MSNTIVLTGGGTAGHVLPNIALLDELHFSFDKIVYIGSEDGIEKQLAGKHNLPYFPITTVKLYRSFSLKNFAIPFLLSKGKKQAIAILKKLQPALVFSKGGYVSLPVVMAAKKLGIPVLVHESDMSMGLANKIAKNYAGKVLVTFENTLQGLKNAVLTGVPIRASLTAGSVSNARMKYQLSGSYPTLLIMGGSSGSKKINETIRLAAGELTKKYNVIHICGKGNISNDEQLKKNQRYVQIDFTEDIADIFALSDLVICRSGSNTINELLHIKKPMLLIPLSKKASRGDQIENAEYFASKGYAQILYEEKLTSQNLIDSVDICFNDRYKQSVAMSTEKKINGVKNVMQQILAVKNVSQ